MCVLTTRNQLEAVAAFINSLPHAACCANWLCGYKKTKTKTIYKKECKLLARRLNLLICPLKSSTGENGIRNSWNLWQRNGIYSHVSECCIQCLISKSRLAIDVVWTLIIGPNEPNRTGFQQAVTAVHMHIT